jgi:hypothetical protein
MKGFKLEIRMNVPFTAFTALRICAEYLVLRYVGCCNIVLNWKMLGPFRQRIAVFFCHHVSMCHYVQKHFITETNIFHPLNSKHIPSFSILQIASTFFYLPNI